LLRNTGGGSPSLDTRFPTYGTLLRDLGYRTAYFGKWHLSQDAQYAFCDGSTRTPQEYGFDDYSCPDPDRQTSGSHRDPESARAFRDWIPSRSGLDQPFCATVSLLNPHDVCAGGEDSLDDRTNVEPVDGFSEQNPPRVFRGTGAAALPPNYEPGLGDKTRLQRYFRQTQREDDALAPFGQATEETAWRPCAELLDLYLLCHQYVDHQIGRVLEGLESAGLAGNTVVVLTSDHGEYGCSHGLLHKGNTAYQEGIRVPFVVKDPTGLWVPAGGEDRPQLTSNVDVAPLLLTLATGGDGWRGEARFSHLRSRADLAGMLRSAAAPGRPYVVHTADHQGPTPPTDDDGAIPCHVIGLLRDSPGDDLPRAKLVTYNHWGGASQIDLVAEGQETELYDHMTVAGAQETENLATLAAPPEAAIAELYDLLHDDALPNELRQPLEDATLQQAQAAAREAYLTRG
jgi:arylsulfatase A-like enzyme